MQPKYGSDCSHLSR